MILRRVADAFKRQDWFVVLIEIFIVVIGIYIGLQVDDWSQARQDKEQDRRNLALFMEDIDLMLGGVERDIEASEELLKTASISMEALHSCRFTEADKDAINFTVNSLRGWRLPNYFVAGFESVKATGTLGRIANREFSRKVGQLGENMTFVKEAGDLANRELNEAFAVLEKYAKPVRLEGAAYPFMLTLPFEDLCGNEDVLKALIQAADSYSGFVEHFNNFKDDLLEVGEIIPKVMP